MRGGPKGSIESVDLASAPSEECSTRLGGGIGPAVKEELAPELVPGCACVLRPGPDLVLPRTQTMASGYLQTAPRPRLTQFRHVGRLSSHYTGFSRWNIAPTVCAPRIEARATPAYLHFALPAHPAPCARLCVRSAGFIYCPWREHNNIFRLRRPSLLR